MARTTLLALAMMCIIVLGFVAEKGVKAQDPLNQNKPGICRDSALKRDLGFCKRNKMKKAAVKFDKGVSDVQTKR